MGNVVGLHLLSWDLPKDNGIKDRIDRLGLVSNYRFHLAKSARETVSAKPRYGALQTIDR